MVTGERLDEQVMTFVEAAGWLERRFGRRPNVATIWRWAIKGIRGVRLRTISLGRYRYTTAGALERFIDQTSTASTEPNATPDASRQATSDKQATRFTDRELAAAQRRREIEKTKAKEFLRQNLGFSRTVKKIPG